MSVSALIVFRESERQLMYHSLIKPCLFRAKCDIVMRAKWDQQLCCYVVFFVFLLKNIKNTIYFDNEPVSVIG